MASYHVMTDYHLDLLSPSCKEFDVVAAGIAQSCPGQCIIAIQKVVSSALEERYQKRKEELQQEGAVKEFTVYHGARNAQAVFAILASGFDASYNKSSAYGKGTYFATAYAYSKKFSGKLKDYKVTLVCNIAIQKMVRGRCGATLPPSEGDCWVDNLNNPTIFSLPDDRQSIPRYVVKLYEERP